MDSIDRYETRAAVFYETTGYIAPGKDVSGVVSTETYEHNRQESWNDFNRVYGRVIGLVLDECAADNARLKSALEAAEETFTAPDGEVWNRPTAEAYYRACQALKKRREELLSAESARDDAVSERGRLRETLAAFLREVGELKVYYDTLLPQAKEVSDGK